MLHDVEKSDDGDARVKGEILRFGHDDAAPIPRASADEITNVAIDSNPSLTRESMKNKPISAADLELGTSM
jgi:hypothetical protein